MREKRIQSRERFSQMIFWRMRPSEKQALFYAAAASSRLTMSRIVRAGLCGGGRIRLNTEFMAALKDLHRVSSRVENLISMALIQIRRLMINPYLEDINVDLMAANNRLEITEKRLKDGRRQLIDLAERVAGQMEEIRLPKAPDQARITEINTLAQKEALSNERLTSRCCIRITPSQGEHIRLIAEAQHQLSGAPFNRSRVIRAAIAGVIFLSIGTDLVQDIEELSEGIHLLGYELLEINGSLQLMIQEPDLAAGEGRTAVRNSLERLEGCRNNLGFAQSELIQITDRLLSEIRQVNDGHI